MRPSSKRREATLAGTDGVVGSTSDDRLLNEPPRQLHQRRLRTIFLDVAATPPLPRRGVCFLK